MSKQTEHTPGEWTVLSNAIVTVGIAGNGAICTCGEKTREGGLILSREIAEANAHLIAAAPELLVALKDANDLLKNSDVQFKICDGGRGNLGEHSLYHRIIKNARAAIAKAKGQP